jgi:hypothetical protein
MIATTIMSSINEKPETPRSAGALLRHAMLAIAVPLLMECYSFEIADAKTPDERAQNRDGRR